MKIDNRENDYQDAPGSKFVQQMRQIKMKRLRPMNCFAKARRKFAHDNFIEKSGLKKNSADHPQEKTPSDAIHGHQPHQALTPFWSTLPPWSESPTPATAGAHN